MKLRRTDLAVVVTDENFAVFPIPASGQGRVNLMN